MATTAATKPAPAAAPVHVTAIREQKLRKAQVKKMRDFNALGYGDVEIATVVAPASATYADVLNPETWANIAPRVAEDAGKTQKDRVGSLVLVNTEDNSFLVWLRINKIVRNHMGNACGVETMCVGPAVDLKTGRPAPLDLKTGLPWVDPAPAKED
jgi:hypothetical protein